ncbi:hypothetical protein T4A_11731 [Trichinella pseudospiralis]|uniref:Uncharacterized protein n=1 Tax=Trichinella pseudospiralis TaxID=6337 RepID=A0A0V1ECL7_TRIPS|nr:hypothetical protein T4A_11731 [Trichinella pseudospiralis]
MRTKTTATADVKKRRQLVRTSKSTGATIVAMTSGAKWRQHTQKVRASIIGAGKSGRDRLTMIIHLLDHLSRNKKKEIIDGEENLSQSN